MSTAFASLAALLLLSSSAWAQQPSDAPQGLFFFKVPLNAQRSEVPAMGFSVRGRSDMPHLPVAEVRFTNGGESLRVLGVDARRLRAHADEATAVDTEHSNVNWWLVGGLTAAAVLVIAAAYEGPKTCNDSAAPVPASPTGAPPPPPSSC